MINIFTMIFLHILDDYTLQGILASLKQQDWWKKNAPDDLYKHDYIAALICHAYSWSFMVHIPLLVSVVRGTTPLLVFSLSLVIHAFIHAGIDHLKANKKRINLIEDQLMHLAQIVIISLLFLI